MARTLWMMAIEAGLWALSCGCERQQTEVAVVNMTWSIDGEDSAERCAAHRAALIEVAVAGPDGRHVDTLVHRCFVARAVDTLDRSFLAEGLAVTLPVGTSFLASARLKDASGNAITRDVTATLSPGALGAGAEPNFEFSGAFKNGTESAARLDAGRRRLDAVP